MIWNVYGNYIFYNYLKYPVTSVSFPATIDKIQKNNMFSYFSTVHTLEMEVDKNYAALTTVYVSENTIIEDGAFMPDVIIERY
jgi:hypothetical protein